MKVFQCLSLPFSLINHFSDFSQASKKKMMIKEGKLDQHGKPNEKTPKDWQYTDYK